MKLKALLLSGICMGTIAAPALAQDAGQAGDENIRDVGPVIVVTAQRREQRQADGGGQGQRAEVALHAP